MEKLIAIKDNKGVSELIAYLQDKEYVAVDTETTGVIESSEIIGYSISAEPDVGYYVVTAYWDVETQKLVYLSTRESAPQVMNLLATKKLIMHNGIFDCAMIENNYKVSLIDSLHTDTMVLAHLLDENRKVGLKELGSIRYGEAAKREQEEMKASVAKNGGALTKASYELYKADMDLMAKYGAKDAILTYNLFYEMVPELFEEGLDKFFYEDESMPLLRGPTYQLNTSGLKIDVKRMEDLKRSLELEILDLKAFIYKEIEPHITDKPKFNIGSGSQLAWLLFEKLGNTFPKLSESGKKLCENINLRIPYTKSDKNTFIETVKQYKGMDKIRDYWTYCSTDATSLRRFEDKYKWVAKLLEYKKLLKLLNTYVEGVQKELRYGVIHPNFLQHGTTSGRYSCRHPNFQNLPRDDKRVKSCVVARPGKVFVGADYSQLEPRVFAYYSQDERLLSCFDKNQDFYSVIGMEVFDKKDCSEFKNRDDFFGKKYETLRNRSKTMALSCTYGTTANKLATSLKITKEEAQDMIDSYFKKFPGVEIMMLEAHELLKKNGYVENLFGRKRRIPEAKRINRMYSGFTHGELPYDIRNLLNLSVNHRIQSTGASIINRAAIRFVNMCKHTSLQARIVLQVHDELIIECHEAEAERVADMLKDAMENTVSLPGVKLIAQPIIGNDLANLK